MRFLRVHIRNFKLLEDVTLQFSTDPENPLTVIRAENGSGKTSFMNALMWAFYGMGGLPAEARDLRLTSSASPAGTPIEVSVMMEFEHTDDSGIMTGYRLIRTVTEEPTTGDSVRRSNERVRLLRVTPQGDEDAHPAEALIWKFVPGHLRNVFFTNGDDVQTFISRAGVQQRQTQVHKAIQALLGLDALRLAEKDIEAAFKNLRANAAKSAGADVETAERALEQTDGEIDKVNSEKEDLLQRLRNMQEQKARWDKELTALRGIGDISQLNGRIESLRSAIKKLEDSRARTLVRMRESLKSEESSWALLETHITKGTGILSDLADRHVIPGTSLEVLTDRLDLGVCICGESLPEGSSRRAQIETLRDEQRQNSERQQRLTALFHTARQSTANHEARKQATTDFAGLRRKLLEEFTQTRDLLKTNGLELKALEEKRAQIDEGRVRLLVEQIAKVDVQIAEANSRLGTMNGRLDQLQEIRAGQDLQMREAEKKAKFTGNLLIKRDVAEDLLNLTSGTLRVLEGDYVERVSDRMNDLFMSIVGSHADFEAGVFTGVHIAPNFDIVVDTHDGRQLDPDFELNGASQRALTLSFIWSLMEVSGTTAPRIIDAPLGYVAGGVKTRMIDTITRPPTAGLPDFQVILLMTRSEIRDIESLLDERAGQVQTMSCSKDYPEDLVYEWGVDRPLVRTCDCSHRQSCRVCARHYDEQHGVTFMA